MAYRRSLQENLLTMLAHSPSHGKILANRVDPNLFEGAYADIATKCVEYWKTYNKPPKNHLPDLLSDIIENKNDHRAELYRGIIVHMLALYEEINEQFVLDDLDKFIRTQQLKSGLIEAAERLEKDQESAVEAVEEDLSTLLRRKDVSFDAGLCLSNERELIQYIERNRTDNREFSLGIKEFDRAGVVPERGTMFMLLGPSGRGKSWFLVHVGVQALLRGMKVLHISLEMGGVQTQLRYYQNIFKIAKHDLETVTPMFNVNKRGELINIRYDHFFPQLNLDHSDVETMIHSLTERFIFERKHPKGYTVQNQLNNLIIKKFATRKLTIPKYISYLDSLKYEEGWEPDMVLFDYPQLMYTDPRNHRISIGINVEELRGEADERNHALVAVHQGTRDTMDAFITSETETAEDITVFNTSDTFVTLSATDDEMNLGLARLWASKARNERDKFGALLSRNLDMGQFCVGSVPLPEEYRDVLASQARNTRRGLRLNDSGGYKEEEEEEVRTTESNPLRDVLIDEDN